LAGFCARWYVVFLSENTRRKPFQLLLWEVFLLLPPHTGGSWNGYETQALSVGERIGRSLG
jgi:hypothetical protein